MEFSGDGGKSGKRGSGSRGRFDVASARQYSRFSLTSPTNSPSYTA